MKEILSEIERWQRGGEAVVVPLTLPDCDETVRLVDLLQDDEGDVGPRGAVQVELDGYGYRWLRVMRPGTRRLL